MMNDKLSCLLSELESTFTSLRAIAYENAPDADKSILEDFNRRIDENSQLFSSKIESLKALAQDDSAAALSHSKRMELFGCLIDCVEDFLEEKGIGPEDIPNDEREGDSAAIIYGSDYDILSNGFEQILIGNGLLAKEIDE